MSERVRFADLLELHGREVHRFAYRMTGNLEDAGDVLQDTFLRALRAFARLPDGANHRAWLFRIAFRQSQNHRRAARLRRTVSIEAAGELSDRSGADAEREAAAAELEAALGGLSARQRAALCLRKYDGLSYAEVAAALQCSEETARAHVYQAMRKLRARLAPGRGADLAAGETNVSRRSP